MDALLQKQLEYNRYEKSLAGGGNLFYGKMAGISRVVRLSRNGNNSSDRTIWNVSANVIGPVLFLFLLWVFERAREKGLGRLYFISRDGQILFEIAQRIRDKWGFEMDCRYLYGSRQAWFYPLGNRFEETEFEELLQNRVPSVHSLCNDIIQDPQILKTELAAMGFVEEDWHEVLNPTQRAKLKDCLFSPAVQTKLQERKRKSRKNTVGYLRQEGLLEDIDCGFVDFGWTGRSLLALGEILSLTGINRPNPIRGFYFGQSELAAEAGEVELNAFLFNNESQFRDITSAFMQLLEIFACADHSSLRYYDKVGSRYEPVLEGNGKNINLEWGIDIQHSGILEFCDAFMGFCSYESLDKTIVEGIVKDLLLSFMKNPEVDEADVYGKFLFSSKRNESEMVEIAPQLSGKDLFRYIFGNKIYREIGDIWIEGAVTRSLGKRKSLIHTLLRARRKLGTLKRRLL